MALPSLRQRLFYGSRYYGDGSYERQSPFFVLTDRVTGTMYRVTVPGGSLSLIPITVLTSLDRREDFMSVQDSSIPTLYLNAYISNGVMQVESSSSRSRDAYIHDGSTRYLLKNSVGSLITVVA